MREHQSYFVAGVLLFSLGMATTIWAVDFGIWGFFGNFVWFAGIGGALLAIGSVFLGVAVRKWP